MPSKFLKDYLSRYGGVHDWHLQAFRVLNNRFSPRRTLYPGSWIHLTPSLVFPDVVYVDSFSKMKKAFNDPDLLQYIEQASILAQKGKLPPTFVSPNVKGVKKDHLQKVYQAFTEFYYSRPIKRNEK